MFEVCACKIILMCVCYVGILWVGSYATFAVHFTHAPNTYTQTHLRGDRGLLTTLWGLCGSTTTILLIGHSSLKACMGLQLQVSAGPEHTINEHAILFQLPISSVSLRKVLR